MYCNECKENPATVHFTKIINGQKQEIHLCEACAKKHKEINLFTPSFSINDLLSSLLDMGQSSQQLSFEPVKVPKCSRCGMTYQQFKKIGRLGCSDCYKAFKSQLTPVLKRVHGSLQHGGKVPKKAGAAILKRKKIEDLKASLNKAIQEEAFEKAAEIRDQIRDLEKVQEQ